MRRMDVQGCALPEDRRYDLEQDVWLRLLPDGTAEMGLVASLVAFAGRFQSLSFRPVSGRLDRGRSVATVESFRYTGAVRLPVTAEILERNTDLTDRPKLLNDDPYGRGWVVRVRPVDLKEVEAQTQEAAQVADALARRIEALHIRCYPASPDVELFEIGAECQAVLARLDEEVGRRSAGDVILLVTDDPTSPIEMVRWQDRSGHAVLAHRREANLHHFLVRKEADPHPRVRGR